MIPTPGIDKIWPEFGIDVSIIVDLRRFMSILSIYVDSGSGEEEEKSTVLRGISTAMMRGVVAESDD